MNVQYYHLIDEDKCSWQGHILHQTMPPVTILTTQGKK